MLTLLLGPSGVGKTTIIETLVAERHWKTVLSYITRPARPNEKFKTSISEREYREWLDHDLFFTHVEQLGGMYGTLRADVDAALEESVPFLLDFALDEYRKFFASVPHQTFIIVPESINQLTLQLEMAGRESRIATAISELENKFADAAVRNEIGDKYKIVVNRHNQLQETVQEIVAALGYARS